MSRQSPLYIIRPESAETLSDLAEKLVRRGGASGVLPTPIDELIAASELGLPEDPTPHIASFLAGLKDAAKGTFLSAMQKIRGIADLRERAIYVAPDVKPARAKWVKAHELAHQVIPWHHVDTGYRDDDVSLSQDAQEKFDQEANFFAGEVIFQGQRFQRMARDFTPSFPAVFKLADDHGASRHATLWRYIEDHDEQVAAVTYWPSQYAFDAAGYPVLRRWKVVASPSFIAKCGDIDIPAELLSPHEWAQARVSGGVQSGEVALSVAGSSTAFRWESWWNSYALFVMLRRRPALHLLRGLFAPRL